MIHVTIFGILVVVTGMLFVATHLRPLSQLELQDMAVRRRKRAIRQYYQYSTSLVDMDLHFKRRMKAKGELYPVSEPLRLFPSIAAGHLKYKKHEWMLIAFERHGHVECMWLNKGERTSVSPRLQFEGVLDFAMKGQYTSILVFHNHPSSTRASNPFDVVPSKADVDLAESWSRRAGELKLSVASFICYRGIAGAYKIKCPDSFLPVTEFLSDLGSVNGKSKLKNLCLHCERLFRRSAQPLAFLGDY